MTFAPSSEQIVSACQMPSARDTMLNKTEPRGGYGLDK